MKYLYLGLTRLRYDGSECANSVLVSGEHDHVGLCESGDFVSAGLAAVARSERRGALPIVCAVDL